MDRDDPAYRGQADYTPFLLRLYDPIVLGVVAGQLLVPVYGADYAAAVPLFFGHLSIVVFDLIVGPIVLLAFPMNVPAVLAISDAIQAVMLLALGSWLIPGMGPMGAVAAKGAAKFVSTAVALALLWRLRAKRIEDEE